MTWSDESGQLPDHKQSTIIVVSGLPRSGTSLMMQVLQEGGIPIFTDSRREPDESNPNGYFEHERVKSLASDNQWLKEAQGQAIKVIVQLLPFLPPANSYKIILMHRDLDEVLASQSKMLESQGNGAIVDNEILRSPFLKSWQKAVDFATRNEQVELLEIEFRDLVLKPQPVLVRIAQFLEKENWDVEKLAMAVVPDLYRNRLQ